MSARGLFVGVAAFSICAMTMPRLAHACGGFFCGRQPVDQTAERILFAVGPDTTTMAVQIQYNGDAADFAWILPLAEVPDPQSLALFPQRALTVLDANTGPQFSPPSDCPFGINVPAAAGGDSSGDGSEPSVTVHYEVEVGPYGAAVVESSDPEALVGWLRDNGYRVTEVMEPYMSVYTREGMKFLALKLLPKSDVNDIQPLKFTLPGQTPSIPIRLTGLAAEPEMGLLVFVLADQRYDGANWESVTVNDADIVWGFDLTTFGMRTNWPALVAKAIDEAGGRGWVTEFAGPSAPYAELIRNQPFLQPDDIAAAQELLTLLDSRPYLTRLYARLSAEEMTIDPIFRRSSEGDVSNVHQLQRYVNGQDLCDTSGATVTPPNPCVFTTCGAGGECFVTETSTPTGESLQQPGCACVPGATARTTFDPSGAATVICQDLRMSFLNPGDSGEAEEALPDPCAGFDCGFGKCESMNMTPTCVCDQGAVAVGSFTEDGQRTTFCVTPSEPIPSSFYSQRLADLPADLPGGRPTDVEPQVVGASGGGGLCTVSRVGEGPARSGMLALLGLSTALGALRRRARRASKR